MIREAVEKRGLKFGELTISECVAVATETGKRVSDVVVEEAMVTTGMTREQVLDAVMASFDHNLKAVEAGITTGSSFIMGTVGNELSGEDAPTLVDDAFVNKVLVYTLGAQVGNHEVGLQPCAGTGDSCPYTGFVRAMMEEIDDRQRVAEVAAVVLKIGTIYRAGKKTTGCNMEGFGAGAPAIAAGFVELEGGTPEQLERAVVIAISPTLANPCTPRVMVAGLCATHIGGAIMIGRLASSLAMHTTLPLQVPADVMMAMAANIHLKSAETIVPIVNEYMEAFFRTHDGVEFFIEDSIKELEGKRKEDTVQRAKLEARALAKQANSITQPFGVAVVGGSSQAVGSPTNTGRIANALSEGTIKKVTIELYPELFARRGINIPGILMASVYGSATDDGLMYGQVMDKVREDDVEVEILQVDEPQLQRVTITTDKGEVMVHAQNRGGARVSLVDANPSKEEAIKAAEKLGIELVD